MNINNNNIRKKKKTTRTPTIETGQQSLSQSQPLAAVAVHCLEF